MSSIAFTPVAPLPPEMRQFIREHQHDDIRLLALQAMKYPEVDMPEVIDQIAGRQMAAHKIPSWHDLEDIIYPSHLPVEQCSSEQTATYKAGLLQGDTFADLTGGFGVDCAFLAARFRQALYVEQQQRLCAIAAHNFRVLGLHHITVRRDDSVKALQALSPVDAIFIDPARRDAHGGKTVLVSDCEPDVAALETLLLQKARRVMIKLSPMLDLSLALRSLPHTCEVHVVSVQNECKELLLILEAEAAAPPETGYVSPPIHCVNLTRAGTQRFTFTQTEETAAIATYAAQVGTYLYEPNASILKAGAFRTIAERFCLEKLHPNSHLYTSNTLIHAFPGRSFAVEGTGSVKDKTLRVGLSQANITVRNFPLSVAALRKQTGLKDGGDTYLFATTLHNDKRVLIRCRAVPAV